MKPVYQTIYGEPNGNCFAACLASLLELPLELVPNFCGQYQQQFVEPLNNWLAQRGLFYLELAVHDPHVVGRWGYHIICGDALNGDPHCLVGQGGQPIHDPHKGWDGTLMGDISYGLLVPLNPAKVMFP